MSTSGQLSTIQTHLEGITNPTPQVVVRGEPIIINASPTFSFWLQSHSQDFETLGDRSTRLSITIRCYWRLEQAQQVKESLELEIYNAIVSIKQKLSADALLGGNCQYSICGTADSGYLEQSGITYKVITLPFDVDVYGEETITP